ncbi:MAG TPA: NAD-dependent epimerase/dehydratase family protein [Candidatus Limnocylindria bacterium]|nr:NAD-dependent epimerase/dehydratase family protein [Candidatus Limnocylindria bacterium]
MRILVTGVAGFVGSHLAEQLVHAGHEVVGIDCFTDYYARSIKERNLADVLRAPGFEFRELDARADSLEAAFEGIDVVINEAAMAGLMRSWSDLDSYVSCNILALERLIDAARVANVRRFVHISTSSVYGTDAVGDEDAPMHPVSPYGVTKLAAEKLLLAHVAVHGFPAAILRYFSIYGPRQRPDMAYHIFTEALMDGSPVTVYGDGLQSRSNTFVDDAVAATIAAMEGARIGHVYNIGGGEEIALLDAIQIIADELGVQPRIRHEEARPGDQRRTWADTRRAKEAFGYVPRVPPREGLAAQVRWQAGLRSATGSGA